MTIWSHVGHWNVNGWTEAQEWGWFGGDSTICLASLSPEILRNWVKVYQDLGLGHLGSEMGNALLRGHQGHPAPSRDLGILVVWHPCLSPALAHSEVEGSSGL